MRKFLLHHHGHKLFIRLDHKTLAKIECFRGTAEDTGRLKYFHLKYCDVNIHCKI